MWTIYIILCTYCNIFMSKIARYSWSNTNLYHCSIFISKISTYFWNNDNSYHWHQSICAFLMDNLQKYSSVHKGWNHKIYYLTWLFYSLFYPMSALHKMSKFGWQGGCWRGGSIWDETWGIPLEMRKSNTQIIQKMGDVSWNFVIYVFVVLMKSLK